ncbi:MAG: glycosyltransferase family 4 protein, partial [Candidatus Cloacimonadales bacterium]|nr:glycosyltransferase family 4 protein [Candidatus Cloacimonadales bacterium]
MAKIKLAHLQLLPLLSGAQNVMLTLLTNLDRERYEIFVISKPEGPLVVKVKDLGFTHISVPALRRDLSLLDGFAFLHIFLIFRKYKFDIVHTHSSKTGFLGRIAARLAGIKKIVHTVHGFPFHHAQPFPIRFFYRSLEKFAATFCDKMVFVNEAEYKFAVEFKIIKKEKAVLIHNCIELKDHEFIKKRRKENDDFIIGSVLRFEKIKNIENTVRAAIRVCLKNKKIVFFFVGDGKLLPVCRKMVINAGLENKILFPGWQNNISEWLNKFDVYLLFSIAEGLSISILEAMAAGLPIVASDVKG